MAQQSFQRAQESNQTPQEITTAGALHCKWPAINSYCKTDNGIERQLGGTKGLTLKIGLEPGEWAKCYYLCKETDQCGAFQTQKLDSEDFYTCTFYTQCPAGELEAGKTGVVYGSANCEEGEDDAQVPFSSWTYF